MFKPHKRLLSAMPLKSCPRLKSASPAGGSVVVTDTRADFGETDRPEPEFMNDAATYENLSYSGSLGYEPASGDLLDLDGERASRSARRPSHLYEILIGEAGHNLVLSRLMSWLIPAQTAMPGLPYDILADVEGAGIVRIQVKTSASPQNGRYIFAMKRGFSGSSHGVFKYEPQDYDIAAFVCLRLSKIYFVASPVQRFSATPSRFMAAGIERQTLNIAVRSFKRMRAAAAGDIITSSWPDIPTPH